MPIEPRLFVEVEGLEPILAALRRPERVYGAALKSWLRKSAETVRDAAKKLAPVDTGELVRSIAAVQIAPYEWTVVASAPHARFVHGGFGRRWGERSQPHWPPLQAIAGWAARHGMPPFVVARAIALRGTPFVPFLTEGMNAAWPRVELFTQQAGLDVESDFQRFVRSGGLL